MKHLKETFEAGLGKEGGGTAMCLQGVVNTSLSGLAFLLETSEEVSPLARLTRCWCVIWEMR